MVRVGRWLTAGLIMAGGFASAPAAQDAAVQRLSDALVASLRPALPYPEAAADGTPLGGGAADVWMTRWPGPGGLRVEVLANPLNLANRERALKAEAEIQRAAMQAQRRSQGDYERALADFERTGRTSEIREISLRDDGLAGEQYDADSQLTIVAQAFGAHHTVSVATSRTPDVLPGADGAAVVVRLPANTYREPDTGGEPGALRYCPEQAWVYIGRVDTPVIDRHGDLVTIEVSRTAGDLESRPLVVWLSGNVELVDRVLQRASWSVLRALAGQ
jgi:hypothetical protein